MDELKLTNGLIKLLSLMDVGHNGVKTGLHNAHGTRRQNSSLVIKPRHEYGDTGVNFAEYVFDGDRTVREYELRSIGAAHTQFVELLTLREAREITLNDERGNPTRARVRRCFGVNHVGVRIRAVGDPHFIAIE